MDVIDPTPAAARPRNGPKVVVLFFAGILVFLAVLLAAHIFAVHGIQVLRESHKARPAAASAP